MTSRTSQIVTDCHTKHSEPQLQGKLPPKAQKPQISPEPPGFCRSLCHGSIWETLVMLHHNKLCISIPSCALFCFSAGSVPPQPGEPHDQQFRYPCRLSCPCTGTAGIFLRLPKFFQADSSHWKSLWAFKASATLPYLKSCLISSYLLPFPPAHWNGPWVNKLGFALNRAAWTASGDLVDSACC